MPARSAATEPARNAVTASAGYCTRDRGTLGAGLQACIAEEREWG